MSDSGISQTAVNAGTTRSASNTRRPIYSTVRNQNLATIASIESTFTGKNKKVAIIGKIHGKGLSFERFMEDVRDFVAMDYEGGDDLEHDPSFLVCRLQLRQLSIFCLFKVI